MDAPTRIDEDRADFLAMIQGRLDKSERQRKAEVARKSAAREAALNRIIAQILGDDVTSQPVAATETMKAHLKIIFSLKEGQPFTVQFQEGTAKKMAILGRMMGAKIVHFAETADPDDAYFQALSLCEVWMSAGNPVLAKIRHSGWDCWIKDDRTMVLEAGIDWNATIFSECLLSSIESIKV